MPCATPPWICPARIIGLITVPQSCTTTYLRISIARVSGSTSMIMAWTPLAVAPAGGPKYLVDSRPGSAPGRTAPRIGFAFMASSPRRTDLPGTPTIDTLPSAISRSSSAHSKCSAARRRIFSRTGAAGLVDGVARHHGAAAREGAGAPVELVGVAGDHVDVAHVDADLVGRDLGEAGEVPLALGADAGGDADLAARLHLHLRALVGPDAGALDIAGDADADVAALRLQARLLVREEILVADQLQRPLQDRRRNCRCRRRAG